MYYTVENKNISFNFWGSLVTLQKRDTENMSMSLDNNFLPWETPATKYHIYSITNFMANILAEKILYSDFSI